MADLGEDVSELTEEREIRLAAEKAAAPPPSINNVDLVLTTPPEQKKPVKPPATAGGGKQKKPKRKKPKTVGGGDEMPCLPPCVPPTQENCGPICCCPWLCCLISGGCMRCVTFVDNEPDRLWTCWCVKSTKEDRAKK